MINENDNLENNIYDVILIGKGPSAITCGIYSLRANLNVIAIAKDFGSMADIECENFYSKKDYTLREIAEDGIEQFEELGGKILEDEVSNISFDGKNYIIETLNSKKLYAKNIFLGMGLKRNKITIPGVDEFKGKGVSYCTICDSFLYKDKDVLLVCKRENLKSEIDMLKKVAKTIYIIVDDKNLELEDYNNLEKIQEKVGNVKILKNSIRDIAEICGKEKVEYIELKNGEKIYVQGVFLSIGMNLNMLSSTLNLKTEKNEIIVDENNMTNIPNIYAGGDITKGVKQITKACYDGMIAALDIIKNN